MKFWLAVIIIAVGTYLFRHSFLGSAVKIQLTNHLRRGLEFVPVSILSSLVAMGFFVGEDKSFIITCPTLAAAISATLVALMLRKDLLTIIIGLAVYYLVDSL